MRRFRQQLHRLSRGSRGTYGPVLPESLWNTGYGASRLQAPRSGSTPMLPADSASVCIRTFLKQALLCSCEARLRRTPCLPAKKTPPGSRSRPSLFVKGSIPGRPGIYSGRWRRFCNCESGILCRRFAPIHSAVTANCPGESRRRR